MRTVSLVVSVALVVVGLAFALFVDVADDMRLFGWILAGVGLLGLAGGWWLARAAR